MHEMVPNVQPNKLLHGKPKLTNATEQETTEVPNNNIYFHSCSNHIAIPAIAHATIILMTKPVIAISMKVSLINITFFMGHIHSPFPQSPLPNLLHIRPPWQIHNRLWHNPNHRRMMLDMKGKMR